MSSGVGVAGVSCGVSIVAFVAIVGIAGIVVGALGLQGRISPLGVGIGAIFTSSINPIQGLIGILGACSVVHVNVVSIMAIVTGSVTLAFAPCIAISAVARAKNN